MRHLSDVEIPGHDHDRDRAVARPAQTRRKRNGGVVQSLAGQVSFAVQIDAAVAGNKKGFIDVGVNLIHAIRCRGERCQRGLICERLCAENAPLEGSNVTTYGKEAYPLEIGVGVEFRNLTTGQAGGNELLYIIIAQNNHGFTWSGFHHAHRGDARRQRPEENGTPARLSPGQIRRFRQ